MLLRAAWLLGVIGSCTAGPGAPAAPRAVAVQPGDIAIADVAVVPMTGEGALLHHTVVIRGDRIAAVAPTASLALPAGIKVIDGAGRWVMPGLADMHVHTWRDDDLTMFLAAGVTTIRNMWGIPQHLQWRTQIARGEKLGPTIVTAGALIDGAPPDWPGSIVLARAEDADGLVAAQKAAGYDFLKPVSQLSPEAYQALVTAGARHGMMLAGHVPIAVGLEGVLAARQRSIEHLDHWLPAMVAPGVSLPPDDGSTARERAVLSAIDPSRLSGLIAQTIAAGSWNCPTLVTLDRLLALDDIGALRKRVAWLDLVPAARRARWTAEFQLPEGFGAEDYATFRETARYNAKITAALAAAGAPLLVGTDAGGAFNIPGAGLHDEIELFVAAGVPRERVLRAATADAWRYLGQPHEAGVVEVGARADLVLLASDPRSAPLPLVPDGVMVRGRWLPRAELEARLAEIAARAAPPVDHWDGAPPLAAEGAELRRVRYDRTTAGTTFAQERVALGRAGNARVITAQIAEFDSGNETSYRVGPDAAEVSLTYHTMTLTLTGKIAGGTLVVTGSDLAGAPVSLTAPVPAGAYLAAPAIGGAIQLAERVAGIPPGGKRALAAIEIGYFPAIAIAPVRYEIERKPDAAGQRRFAVTATRGTARVASELVVDAGGAARWTTGSEVTARVDQRTSKSIQ